MYERRWHIGAVGFILLVVIGYVAASCTIVNQALVAEANDFEHLPEDLGLVYEDVSFQPRSEEPITLRGWWLPAAPEAEPAGAVIWVHGLDGTRAQRLPLLAELVEAGFDVLTFDLRGHGQSDKALMGAGLHEQDDLRGAIDYALSERGVTPGQLLLVGSSFGAAIVLEVGPDEPAVAGVYADSSFASLSDMIVDEVARRLPVPRFAAALLKPGMVTVGRITKGIDLDEVKPEEAAARYQYRIGIAHCQTDDRIPYEHAIRIWQNMPRGSAFVSYPCAHANGYDDFPEQYFNNVLQYLTQRLNSDTEVTATP